MAGKIKRQRIKGNFIAELSPGEKLFIWRRRKNLNQDKAAKIFKVSVFEYKLAEYDKRQLAKLGYAEISVLQPHERCVLYRRRSGMKQEEIAGKLGISRNWLRQLESGKEDPAKLLAFWEGVP